MPSNAFLKGEIGFPGIAAVVEETLSRIPNRQPHTVADILEIDKESRSMARAIVARAGPNGSARNRFQQGFNRMVFFQSAFWFMVLIGVMILIHELGHFWAARFFDVRVDTFSFGFGPRLFGFRRGETDYRVSAVFFLGGFVKMAGELPGDESANDPRGFLAKPRWQRLIIVLAGPLMNVVLAVGLLTGLYMVKYQKVVDADNGAVIGA